MSKDITVYVLRDGLIVFGPPGPDGAIPAVSGPEDILRPIVEVNATHCWDNKSFRVGNLATTTDEEEAFDLLCEWVGMVKAQLQTRQHELQEVSHA